MPCARPRARTVPGDHRFVVGPAQFLRRSRCRARMKCCTSDSLGAPGARDPLVRQPDSSSGMSASWATVNDAGGVSTHARSKRSPAPQMHDGDYRNILGLDLVYSAEWKTVHEAPPIRATREQITSVWMGNDSRPAWQFLILFIEPRDPVNTQIALEKNARNTYHVVLSTWIKEVEFSR